MDENKRGSFGSTIGFLLSAIGSAVGLGNIWGFPYKMGRCGGFTFLIVYLALAAFVGFAIMLSELAIGRAPASARSTPIRRSRRSSSGSAGWPSSPRS